MCVCVLCFVVSLALQGGEVNVPELIAKTARTGGISVGATESVCPGRLEFE